MLARLMSPGPGVNDWPLALDALIECGLKRDCAGCRPAEPEVADTELGTRLLALAALVGTDPPPPRRASLTQGFPTVP
jgi:hypothetical protein